MGKHFRLSQGSQGRPKDRKSLSSSALRMANSHRNHHKERSPGMTELWGVVFCHNSKELLFHLGHCPSSRLVFSKYLLNGGIYEMEESKSVHENVTITQGSESSPTPNCSTSSESRTDTGRYNLFLTQSALVLFAQISQWILNLAP